MYTPTFYGMYVNCIIVDVHFEHYCDMKCHSRLHLTTHGPDHVPSKYVLL